MKYHALLLLAGLMAMAMVWTLVAQVVEAVVG